MIPDDESYEELRQKTESMSIDERIAFALELGKQEVQAYAIANDVTEEEAVYRWRLRSQFGRRFSRCKVGEPPGFPKRRTPRQI
jgi:hypothetical protein